MAVSPDADTNPIASRIPGQRGRFAPSPTGPLHFGSLIAALGSFLDARAADNEWLVRIEDLDHQRVVPGAATSILRTLERFGLHWDGPVVYQHQRLDLYQDALADLKRQGLTYLCGCSRQRIAAVARQGPEGAIYPGTCRTAAQPTEGVHALRLRVPPGPIMIQDLVLDQIVMDVAAELGDFVVQRADGIPAYHLAVVVDDAAQGINRIVRGADLLLSALRQRVLQQALRLPLPTYAHLPLALDDQGRKLSKSTSATALDAQDPLTSVRRAWHFLGQRPLPSNITQLDDFWPYAIQHWSINLVRH